MNTNRFTGVVILVVFSIIAVLIVGLVLIFINQYGKYEYTTSSGETGTANFCTVSYGRARCRAGDTTIMVERYTKNE